MGKKRSKVTITEDTNIEIKKSKFEKQEIEEVNLNILNDKMYSRITKQKRRKIIDTNNTELLKLEDKQAKAQKKYKVKNTQAPDTELVKSESKQAKTKKIDEPQEVSVSSGTVSTAVEKKNKKFLNDDEAEVKEEDIDTFCDELDEEDNKQYEDWVKLIEDKLHSNKKN